MSDNTHADGSPQVEWNRLIDMPADVLAHRVVGSFILAKGNLNEYKAIVQRLLEDIAKEHAAMLTRPEELSAEGYANGYATALETAAQIAEEGLYQADEAFLEKRGDEERIPYETGQATIRCIAAHIRSLAKSPQVRKEPK